MDGLCIKRNELPNGTGTTTAMALFRFEPWFIVIDFAWQQKTLSNSMIIVNRKVTPK